MTVTFQIQLDPYDKKLKFTPEQLSQMREYMLEFVDNIYIESNKEYIRSEMRVDGEIYNV